MRSALLFLLSLFVDERIGEFPVRPDVDKTPFILAGERIDVASPEIAAVAGLLQRVDGRRVLAFFANVELDGSAVLQSPFDEQLFPVALRFKRNAWEFHVKAERGRGRQKKHEQEHKTGLVAASAKCYLRLHPVTGGSSSGSVC